MPLGGIRCRRLFSPLGLFALGYRGGIAEQEPTEYIDAVGDSVYRAPHRSQ
jgi:hypothetical protein